MKKPKEDPVREERIDMEIVVDCYNEHERYMGWYCYLEGKLKFPFQAKCTRQRPISPLKKGESVTVIGMLDDDSDYPSDMMVKIRWQNRTMGVPLSQLEGLNVSADAKEAVTGTELCALHEAMEHFHLHTVRECPSSGSSWKSATVSRIEIAEKVSD